MFRKATKNTHYRLLFQSYSLLMCLSTTTRHSKTPEVTWYNRSFCQLRPAVPRKYNSSFAHWQMKGSNATASTWKSAQTALKVWRYQHKMRKNFNNTSSALQYRAMLYCAHTFTSK